MGPAAKNAVNAKKLKKITQPKHTLQINCKCSMKVYCIKCTPRINK